MFPSPLILNQFLIPHQLNKDGREGEWQLWNLWNMMRPEPVSSTSMLCSVKPF